MSVKVTKRIIVNCPQERAFQVFTAGINAWWPKEHHVGSSPSVDERIEPRVGGRWYSLNEDGSETDVGRVVAWQPSELLGLTWQINSEWAFDPDFVTHIEVRFHRIDARTTEVILEHRDLERFGEAAAQMRAAFESDEGWAKTLASFARVANAGEAIASRQNLAARG